MGKTSLEELIKDEEVCDLYICGIATDVCVGELDQWTNNAKYFRPERYDDRILSEPKLRAMQCFAAGSTAFHANELGFRTILIDDCSRGINEDNIQSTFNKLKSEFACVVQSHEVGKDHNLMHAAKKNQSNFVFR